MKEKEENVKEEEEGEDMEDVVHEVPIEEGEEVQEVAIEGDGDCFYSAIVEAFRRNGLDIADYLTDLPEAEVKIFNSIAVSGIWNLCSQVTAVWSVWGEW